MCYSRLIGGGAESTGKRQVGPTEKASTKQRILQGWKTHVQKTQVRICRDGKRKYGKFKYNATHIGYSIDA